MWWLFSISSCRGQYACMCQAAATQTGFQGRHLTLTLSHQCVSSSNIRTVHRLPPGSNTHQVLKAEWCSQELLTNYIHISTPWLIQFNLKQKNPITCNLRRFPQRLGNILIPCCDHMLTLMTSWDPLTINSQDYNTCIFNI